MGLENRWLLPEGIEELLPADAARVEVLRRRILDLYRCWGYDLVIPPLIEYLESLLVGTGHDLDLQTFKLIDQLNGRTMGLRADITPQVARIDAHRLRQQRPTRLCYVGTVVHTRPDEFGGERSPIQIGAEIYGHQGVASDAEIVCLAVETLRCAGLDHISLDLGHVGIYRGLVKYLGLNVEQDARLFEMLQRKSAPEIAAYLGELDLDAGRRQIIEALPALAGDVGVLQRARELLIPAGEAVGESLDYLQAVEQRLRACGIAAEIHFDLGEFRGYHYETGLVFAAYVPGHGQEVARGGRYDDIGRVFGRARAATGFSTDLKLLGRLGQDEAPVSGGIFAPADEDPGLWQRIRELRNAGERVVCALPGQLGGAPEMGCDRILVAGSDGWSVKRMGK